MDWTTEYLETRSNPHFIKVFLPELSAENLKIPPDFRVHLERESLGLVSLRGPSGNVWDVELVDRSTELLFESGWKEFVADHDLDIGDLLVFRLDGCSCFSVTVYDTTACKKESAFLAKPCCENSANDSLVFVKETVVIDSPCHNGAASSVHFKEEELEEQVRDSKALASSPVDVPIVEKKRKTRRVNSIMIQESNSEEMFSVADDCKCNRLRKRSVVKTSASSQSPPTQSSRQKLVDINMSKQSHELSDQDLRSVKTNDVCRRGDVVGGVQKLPALISERRSVTKEEIEKALHKAKSFKPKNPCFRVVMCDYHVYKSFYMNIPSYFAKAHLPKATHRVTLWDEDDKPWEVTYAYCNSRGALSGGWGTYSFAHNLESSDVCVFELIRNKHFKVHTFRVINKMKPLRKT